MGSEEYRPKGRSTDPAYDGRSKKFMKDFVLGTRKLSFKKWAHCQLPFACVSDCSSDEYRLNASKRLKKPMMVNSNV
eukprot:scaffold19336_cov199-Amphora_coffeaeformis.AAC.4